MKEYTQLPFRDPGKEDKNQKLEFDNILIRMPNWIGDLVMATPILADVDRKWPKAKITAMCQGTIAPLLIGHPHIDEMFTFSRPHEFLRRPMNRDLIQRIRQGKYDLGILLSNSFSSAWWFWRGGVKRRIGFASNWRSFILNDAIAFPKERGKEHLVETYKRLLTVIDIPISKTQPKLFVTEEEQSTADEILRQCGIPREGKIVGINPNAAYGPAKCWLPTRFRSLIEKLVHDPKIYVICFGDQGNTSFVDKICDNISPQVINLAGMTSLRELMALIKKCTVFLTNDSGPMHIAAALKTPLLALFGSTNEMVTGPYHHGEVIHKHVDCSPCYKRTCPIDFRCMKQINVEEVYQALLPYLE
ncbi:MAG: lipopolysaccharide heptosyltransferase II [Chlamydiales bacterium]